jgi:hypothetical protein
MTPDDAYTSHNHGFELPNAPLVVERRGARPWRAVAGVAVCLGLAGVVTGIVVAQRQRVSDAHLTSDALQREELRDGWRALGMAAAQDALTNDVQASPPAATGAPAATPPSVVIVNVPAPNANAAPPSNVTNITLPSGSAPSSATGTEAALPARPSTTAGYMPTQSLPSINFSPAPGYVPSPGSYTSPAPSAQAPSNDSASNGYGTSPSGDMPYPAPVAPVGNGSIPGSAPNPAVPNSGLVGSTPTPGQPNGPVTGGFTP